jgi:small subunit ribosomal protein S21|tara:strand:+ start:140 stop:343 length:204 start_codon:yes stop_codon:yes gene_type:complete
VRVEVRNNNVDKAMRILKKKLTEDGFFNELREREHYVSRGEKRRHERAAAKRRQKKNLEKRMLEQGY